MAQQCELSDGRKGRKALSFSFNGLNINEFYGGFGGKYWTSNNTALFGSIDFELYYDYEDYDKDSDSDRKSRQNDLSLTLGMEKHFYACRKVSPYWGFYGRIGHDYAKIIEDPSSNYDSAGGR